MKRFLLILLLSALSFPAISSCYRMNVHSSGAYIFSGENQNIYGPYTLSCIGSNQFKFEDLTSHQPSGILRHKIEMLVGNEWQVISEATSYGATSITRSFTPPAAGTYQYRVENIGTARVRAWKMTGYISL